LIEDARFRAILFDLDGVLVQGSESVNIEAAKKTFSDMEAPLSEEETRTIPGRSSLKFIPPLLAARRVYDLGEVSRTIAANRANYDALWEDMVQIEPSAPRTISELRARKVVLAIVTTNRRSVVERFYRRFDLGRYFNFAITSEDVKDHKPHPAGYLKGARIFEDKGIPFEKIAAVDDTGLGVTAAKAAGLWCAAFPNEHSKDHDFSQADMEISSLMELLFL